MEHAQAPRNHDTEEPEALCEAATHDSATEGLSTLCHADRRLLLRMGIEALNRSEGAESREVAQAAFCRSRRAHYTKRRKSYV